MIGTASGVRTWLLLEYAGPWSATALDSHRLPAGLGAELARRANRTRVRIVLIRRAGRTPAGRPPACFVAHTRPDGSWLARTTLNAHTDALDVDLAAISTGSVAGFETVAGPLLCVCTHGRHDPCCAERGRPVAAALADRFPDLVWEVSHVGGDRFAGNVVVLPDGDYLGRLDHLTAVPVIEDYLEGRYPLPHLRGRAGYLPAVQAAEILVRQRLSIDRRGAVRVHGSRHDETGEVEVRLSVDGHGDLIAKIHMTGAEPARSLTCYAERSAHPPTYELIDLTPAGPSLAP